jgi:hypothetical protein
MGIWSSLYKIARIMGDVNAIQKGKVGRRVARRAAGKVIGHGVGDQFSGPKSLFIILYIARNALKL